MSIANLWRRKRFKSRFLVSNSNSNKSKKSESIFLLRFTFTVPSVNPTLKCRYKKLPHKNGRNILSLNHATFTVATFSEESQVLILAQSFRCSITKQNLQGYPLNDIILFHLVSSANCNLQNMIYL